MYALTIHTSMILTARFLMGVHCGYGLVLLTSYIGVTTDQLEAEKQGTWYIILGVVYHLATNSINPECMKHVWIILNS